MVVIQFAELVLQNRKEPHLDMNERIAKRGRLLDAALGPILIE